MDKLVLSCVVAAVSGAVRGLAGQSSAASPSRPLPAVRAWPNEPPGFTTIADNSFNAPDDSGWALIDNTQNLATRSTDATAPFSPPGVLQYRYPVGFPGGSGPAAEYVDLPNLRSVYVGTWWKVSNPWQGNPANVNKVEILFPAEGGDIYLVMYGTPGGPYELRVIPQFKNMPSDWMLPNVNHVPVTLGVWHRIEWLLIYNSSPYVANGVIRWWLDGKLLGDYRNVRFPATPLVTYKVSAIWGGVAGIKRETDYYWYDHVHISGR